MWCSVSICDCMCGSKCCTLILDWDPGTRRIPSESTPFFSKNDNNCRGRERKEKETLQPGSSRYASHAHLCWLFSVTAATRRVWSKIFTFRGHWRCLYLLISKDTVCRFNKTKYVLNTCWACEFKKMPVRPVLYPIWYIMGTIKNTNDFRGCLDEILN